MNWNVATAVLDFYSVVAALVTAIGSRKPIRGGRNKYEVKKDKFATTWNRIWDFAFAAAFATAATSVTIKAFIIG